jgi:hypothetical protein
MGGGRNARATSFATCASSGNPPAIHPRESPAAAGSAAITQQAQKLATCSLNPLSDILFFAATGKLFVPVKNVWTVGLSCGSKRKTENLAVLTSSQVLSHSTANKTGTIRDHSIDYGWGLARGDLRWERRENGCLSGACPERGRRAVFTTWAATAARRERGKTEPAPGYSRQLKKMNPRKMDFGNLDRSVRGRL